VEVFEIIKRSSSGELKLHGRAGRAELELGELVELRRLHERAVLGELS